MYYTGVGARVTPGKILNLYDDNPMSLLIRWGRRLALLGFTLRSGAADGADHAFESGCDMVGGKKEIYLPWQHFNSSDSELHYIPSEAYEIAGDIYGTSWKFQTGATKKFMARNIMQVMGLSLEEPSSFLLCWTLDGCASKEERTKKTGGTGQAIAYADEMEVPIFNFSRPMDENKFIDFLFNNLKELGIQVNG